MKTSKEASASVDSSPKDNEDFRIERIMSAPPHDLAKKNDQVSFSSGSFVLTNDDGTPLEVSSSDSDMHQGSSEEIDTPQNARALEEILNGSSSKTADTLEEARSSESLSDWDFEAESSEEEPLSCFVRFMQIERLVKEFPPLDLSKIESSIEQILGMKQRTAVDIKFIFAKGESPYVDKISSLKNKVHTSLEKVRFEFNRVTESTKMSVLQTLLKTKVEKIDEMKEIATFVFEKIISEPLFFDIYIWLVSELKKSWKCEEEKALANKSQTCFFGTLLTLAAKKIDSKHTWSTQVDVSSLKALDREDLETQIEQFECERIARKKQALGAVDFFVSLYCNNVTGPANVCSMISKLTSSGLYENIEMLCHVFAPLSAKLAACDKHEMLNTIVEFLKKHEKSHDMRLEFMVNSALKSNPLSASPKPVSSHRNTFAALADVEAKPSQKAEPEIVQEYIQQVSKSLELTSDEDDIEDLGDQLYREMDRFTNSVFFVAYFTEMLTNYKTSEKMLGIFLAKLLPKAVSLKESLHAIKDEMPMLGIDFPISTKKYAELLCHLRADNHISAEDLNSLKLNEFLKRGGELLRKWRSSQDDRLYKVISAEDVQKL